MRPNTPELPPMAPMTPSSPAASSPAPASAGASAPVGGSRRLRQAAAVLASGGFVLIAVILLLQLIARPGLRPTDLMAMMEAQTHLGQINQLMGHAPGEHVLNEAQYQEILARAQRQGAAKAELEFQRELASVQADKERVVGAYSTLYQRTNIIAQAGVQMEGQALQFRQALIQQTNGGRAVVIGVYDMVCALGDTESCEKARQARQGMMNESNTLTEGDVARKVRELMAGIPDPAAFVARDDQRRNGTPALPR